MADTGLHFAQPDWFWALLILIPVAVWLWYSAQRASHGPIHKYADQHLLPHLTGSRELGPGERWGRFALWGLLWAVLIAAMAGPRWGFTDVRVFRPGNNLLVLLDISRSMETADVAPSRLARARQEVQDLITQNRQLRIGLIAFASVPHIVSPVTEDTASIRNALPALTTELARLQGSRLHAALDQAEVVMNGLAKDAARSILLISDGDFDETDLVPRIRRLAQEGIHFHVLSVGTPEGAEVPAPKGGYLADRNGRPVYSRLNEALLRQLAEAGNGSYRRADFRDDDTQEILSEATGSLPATDSGDDDRARVWNEQFYLLLFPVLALLLPGFRKSFKKGGAA